MDDDCYTSTMVVMLVVYENITEDLLRVGNSRSYFSEGWTIRKYLKLLIIYALTLCFNH